MKQKNIKKLLLLNLPYFLLGLYATKLGQAYRLATGADLSGSCCTSWRDSWRRSSPHSPASIRLTCWWAYAAARPCGLRST